MCIMSHLNINPAATGLIAGLLEVSGESRDFESEPAELCQGCLHCKGMVYLESRNLVHR